MYSISSNGWGGGAPTARAPSQPAGKGASAPTTRGMSVHAVVSSDQRTVRVFIATTKTLGPDTVINAKGAWFIPKVGMVAKLSCMRTYGSKH